MRNLNGTFIARSRYHYTVAHVKNMEFQMEVPKNYGGAGADASRGSYTTRATCLNGMAFASVRSPSLSMVFVGLAGMSVTLSGCQGVWLPVPAA